MDMDISMDIHGKSVDMDMDMDGKYHIHGKPDLTRHNFTREICENDAFFWPTPPYAAAAAGRNAHAAAAAKMGSARRRRRPSWLETPPPTLTWSAHRSGHN